MQDWLSYRARVTPEATALIRARTGEALSFGSLDGMVDDLARRLAALGVSGGDSLGMVMESRLAAVCTVHAATRLGAVLVPLSHQLTSEELSTQLDAADVTTLVCSEKTERQAVEAAEAVPLCSVDDPKWNEVRALAETEPVSIESPEWELDDTQLLLFTSGTTGSPKAVRLTAGNLFWSAVASAFRLGVVGDDRWLVTLSLHHMGGLSPVLRAPLYGMTVVLRESFEPGRAADDIDSYDVTCVSLVPTMLRRMLSLRGTLADSLRLVLLGGAPAPDDLLRRCRDFSIPVHPTYGMTETASQIATATPKEAFANLGTVGRPLFWTELSVRDDDGTELPAGDVGEFVVSGPTVTPGYYGDTGPDESSFTANGLRTGDVGYLDDKGRAFVLGRVDDRIVTGGENVSPAEVVDVLEDHEGVEAAAVVGIPDDVWGERVAALVVPSAGGDGEGDAGLTIAELNTHCRERLAGFKIPRVFAFTDELPRTDSGTVRRDAVRDHLVSAGEPIPDAEERTERDVEAGTPPGATGDDAETADVGEGLSGAETDASHEPGRADDDAGEGTDRGEEVGDESDADGDDPERGTEPTAVQWRRAAADRPGGDDETTVTAPSGQDEPAEQADFTRMTPPTSEPGEPKMDVTDRPTETDADESAAETDADESAAGTDADETAAETDVDETAAETDVDETAAETEEGGSQEATGRAVDERDEDDGEDADDAADEDDEE